MTTGQAIAKAEAYTKIRKQVRKALIEEAKRLVDIRGEKLHTSWFEKISPEHHVTLRKLYRYPSDLSDERILQMIEVFSE